MRRHREKLEWSATAKGNKGSRSHHTQEKRLPGEGTLLSIMVSHYSEGSHMNTPAMWVTVIGS